VSHMSLLLLLFLTHTLELRVNITDSGKQALLKLSKGDMRRVLNVLQVGVLAIFRYYSSMVLALRRLLDRPVMLVSPSSTRLRCTLALVVHILVISTLFLKA
jgi:replication-associated recombination protein RarA